MKEITKTSTPYEEMNRSFILRLIELRDKRGTLKELSEFLKRFIRIDLPIKEAHILESVSEYSRRIGISSKQIPNLQLNEKYETTEFDWIIDFLFFDHYKLLCSEVEYLSLKAASIYGVKKALIHFGCSPDSYSGEMIRNAYVSECDGYDAYHSITPYEMSDFLKGGERFDEKYFEVYAGIIDSHAKKKALSLWQRNALAFSFLCEKVIYKKLQEKIGRNLIVETIRSDEGEATVCFNLPAFEWDLFDNAEFVATLLRLTLHVHFIAGEPLAHLGVSLSGPINKNPSNDTIITREQFDRLFYKRFDVTKAGFIWAKDIINFASDEFAYSYSPLWIYSPWEEEKPEMRLDLTPEYLAGRLADDISEIINQDEDEYRYIFYIETKDQNKA